MCGRYTYSDRKLAALARQLETVAMRDIAAAYNVAPTMSGPVVLGRGGNPPTLEMMTWGIRPPHGKLLLNNARCETVAKLGIFREAFQQRRCLVLADGFYEWQAGSKPKQPFLFTLQDPGMPMVMAGIWTGYGAPGERTEAFSIVTTDANDVVGKIHDRMPVILKPEDWRKWLDVERPADEVKPLMRPTDMAMQSVPVSPQMNKVSFQGEECLKPWCPEQSVMDLGPVNSA